MLQRVVLVAYLLRHRMFSFHAFVFSLEVTARDTESALKMNADVEAKNSWTTDPPLLYMRRMSGQMSSHLPECLETLPQIHN